MTDSYYNNKDPRQYYSPPSSYYTARSKNIISTELKKILDSELLDEMTQVKDSEYLQRQMIKSNNLSLPCEKRVFPRATWTGDEDMTFPMLLGYFYEALDNSEPGNTKTINVVVGMMAPGFYFHAFLALQEYLYTRYGLAIRDSSHGDGVLKVRVFLGNMSYLYGAIGDELGVGEDHMYRNRIEKPSLAF